MRDGSRRRGAKGCALALGAVLVLAGCSTAPTATSPVATPGAQLVLAAFGDSITADPGGIYVCSDCTPFVDRYAEALTAATGTSVAVRNLGRPSLRVEVLLQDLMASSSLMDAVASA